MTELEKMIKSCEDFSENIKNTKWFILNEAKKQYKCSIAFIDIYFWLQIHYDCEFFYYSIGIPKDKNIRRLTATTAQEAAAEALELCRKEAQKLVDLLSEQKEQNYTKEFLEWKSKYFDKCDNVVLEWEDKKEKMKYSTKELIFMYEKAFKEKAFLNKTK